MTFSHGARMRARAPPARRTPATLYEGLLTRMPGLRPTQQPVSGVSRPLSEGLPDEVRFTW